MKKFEELTNNEILLEIKQMQIDHENIKLKMLKDYEELESIEKAFNVANEELIKRLKGNK